MILGEAGEVCDLETKVSGVSVHRKKTRGGPALNGELGDAEELGGLPAREPWTERGGVQKRG